jgi:regulator of protease activity HflC (stomatin/prohibitin superfamily)
MNFKNLILAVIAAIGATACSPASVDAGQVGVKTQWGAVQPDVYQEGLYITWVGQDIVSLDARVQKKEVSASASSKDLQVVSTAIALNYRIDTANAPKLYQSVGDLAQVEANIIDPVLMEAVKTATAQYNAEELITERRQVKDAITNYVKERLEQSYLVVTDLSIVNFTFDAKYQDAIEAKQVAEQQALAAGNDLKRIEVEAKQAEASAQGRANAMLIEARSEAERQELLRSTMTPELVQWEAIQKWNGAMPTVMGEGANAIIDFRAITGAAK